MGYELHITRRRRWSDEGRDITAAEWLDTASTDSGLQLECEWFDGVVSAKNPSPELIDRMVTVARTLRATVQGDDGETYVSGTSPALPYAPTVGERVRAFISNLRPAPPATPAPLPPFGIGDAVQDPWGHRGRVVAMDQWADHGLGFIVVRYESGREAKYSMLAHGLTIDRPK